MNSKAQEALKLWREQNKGVKITRLNPVEKAKANPKSLRLAITAKCWDCSNFDKTEVQNCTCKDCPLWNLRPWSNSKESTENLEEGLQESTETC